MKLNDSDRNSAVTAVMNAVPRQAGAALKAFVQALYLAQAASCVYEAYSLVPDAFVHKEIDAKTLLPGEDEEWDGKLSYYVSIAKLGVPSFPLRKQDADELLGFLRACKDENDERMALRQAVKDRIRAMNTIDQLRAEFPQAAATLPVDSVSKVPEAAERAKTVLQSYPNLWCPR